MPQITNGQHIVREYPTHYPIPGQTTVYETSTKIDLDTVPLNGGVLVKLLLLSIDPYLRGRLSLKSRSPNPLNSPLIGIGIVKVIRSEHEGFRPGDLLYGKGNLRHEEYSILSKEETAFVDVLTPDQRLPLSVYVGAAGMPGMTAFTGWKEFADAKKGETVFVSTAAGAVGSMVVQIAKSEGLKVIGSAGSDEKVQFLKELGVDAAFNYKTTDTREVLKKEGPVDIFWDNVGGDTLDAYLENCNLFGRVIICGAIATYNGQPPPVKNLGGIMYS